MKNRTSLLIFSCIATVFALLAIQAHFIRNTYDLKEKEILSEVKRQMSEFVDDSKLFGDKYDKDIENREYLNSYVAGNKDKKQLISNFQKNYTDHSRKISQLLKKKFGNNGYNISMKKKITIIMMISGDVADTLYNGEIILYETKKNLKNLVPFSGSASSVYCDDDEKELEESLKCRFFMKLETSFGIDNINTIILSELIGLLTISLLILLFVVFLFYFSLKNLIKQKKIAEIQRDFINNITHEFKTPLATLTIATETLQRKDLDKKTLKNTTSIIQRQNNRLQKIFNQASFDSLLSDENADLEKVLNQASIENCVNDFKLLNPKTTILSEIEINQNIQTSRFHFNTILTNLLENAVKYKGTEVIVNAKIVDNKFIFSVSDNGIGIPKKEHKAIFDKFYRIQKGDIHTTKGLGLGLFYTKQIVDKYSGKINVICNENSGVTFVISIPIQ